MDFLSSEVRDILMKEHFEFRKLMHDHQSADERLKQLQTKAHLSAKESIEETDLKKAKLMAKERILRIVNETSFGSGNIASA